MEETSSLAPILRAVLARDRSLLGRREELLAALDAQARDVNVFEYGSLKRALRDSTVGETLYAADALGSEAREQARTEALASLRALGMQERVVQRVVDTIVEALAWGEEPAAGAEPVAPEILPPEAEPLPGGEPPVWQTTPAGAFSSAEGVPAETSSPAATTTTPPSGSFVPAASAASTGGFVSAAPAAPASPASPVWSCRCGQTGNRGRFCVGCGRSRAEGEVPPEAVWDCICGHHANKGRFCVACGRAQADGDARTHASLIWACTCGHRGNKGKFCVGCGRSRAEGEVSLWDCVCGHTGNAGRFCVACGRSRDDGAR